MTTTDYHADQAAFLAQWASPTELLQLLDCLPEAYFFAKDARGRFMLMNEANLRLHGVDTIDGVLGKTDFDFHPRHLAEQYVREDRRVMDSGVPLLNQVWLVGDAYGQLRWYISSKTPLRDPQGKIVGIAGIMRDFKQTESLIRPYQELEQVLSYVLEHYAERIRVEDLAAMAHLSVSQFDRKFKRLLQITPQQYLMRVRINAASQALLHTDRSIATIADQVGFYDQSIFTKQFVRHVGMTPRIFRRTYTADAHQHRHSPPREPALEKEKAQGRP
ncbi:helix-turn-helix domain-containing protein [bacterium]|nr:helix-turn-helix domain-containing protein [bacterium]